MSSIYIKTYRLDLQGTEAEIQDIVDKIENHESCAGLELLKEELSLVDADDWASSLISSAERDSNTTGELLEHIHAFITELESNTGGEPQEWREQVIAELTKYKNEVTR